MTSTAQDGAINRSAWAMLLLAGVFEIGYALSVGGSQAFTKLGWSLVALVFFLLTLFFLSVALKTIDVGIGYAVWAGIGSVGSAILGAYLFDQPLNPVQAFFLAVIIGGVVWLKLADSPKLETRNSNETTSSEPALVSAGPRN